MSISLPPDIDLDSLSQKDQRELFNRLSAKFDRAAGPKASAADRETYDLLDGLLQAQGQKSAPFNVFVKSFGLDKYIKVYEQINSVISKGTGRLIRKQQRLSLTRECLNCLIEYRRQRNWPITMNTILNSANLIESAIDANYPGYIKQRMLDRISGLV
jgi:hypothetical protein